MKELIQILEGLERDSLNMVLTVVGPELTGEKCLLADGKLLWESEKLDYEMLADYRPPILLQATLIPFGNCIISDGLVYPQNIIFGSGAGSDFKDFYMNAKQNGKIITSL